MTVASTVRASASMSVLGTEAILEQLGATEETWREVAESNPEAKRWGFIASETPRYVGRALAALAADPGRSRFSGGVYSSATLSERYEFTDVDGTRPNMTAYLREHHGELLRPKGGVVHWAVETARAAATAAARA